MNECICVESWYGIQSLSSEEFQLGGNLPAYRSSLFVHCHWVFLAPFDGCNSVQFVPLLQQLNRRYDCFEGSDWQPDVVTLVLIYIKNIPSFSFVFYYFRSKAVWNPKVDMLYLTFIVCFEAFMMCLFRFILKYQHKACKAFCSHRRSKQLHV